MSKNGNLKREDITNEIRLIEETKNYYVTNTGDIYKLTSNNLFLKMKKNLHKNGYEYIHLKDIFDKIISRRVHRLVAIAFIENPNNYSIVGHKNNIKNDNRVENLYWTTISENTQKAFDDKLIINAKGYDDSQSYPVIVFDKNMNEIDKVGSISLCAKKYKVSKSTITRHCKNQIKGKTRCGYYFKYDNK